MQKNDFLSLYRDCRSNERRYNEHLLYLRDLQRSQDKKFDVLDKKFDGLRETMNELKVQNSRLPVIALGTALLGFGFLEYVGYKARLLKVMHESRSELINITAPHSW